MKKVNKFFTKYFSLFIFLLITLVWFFTFGIVFFYKNNLGVFFPIISFVLLFLLIIFERDSKKILIGLSFFVVIETIFIFCLNVPSVDDAYISFRYALNLATGQGLVFNPNEYVEGYSNFFWIIILAFFSKLGFYIPSIAKVLSGIILGGYYLVSYQLIKLFKNSGDLISKKTPLTFMILSSFLGIQYWSTTGLETIFYAFLLLVAIFYFLRFIKTSDKNLLIISFIAFLFLSLTRIEGIIFGFTAIFFTFIYFRKFIKTSLILFIPYVLYTLFRFFYYKSVVSHVFLHKGSSDFFLPWYNGFGYLLNFFLSTGLFIILLLIIIQFIKNRKSFFSLFTELPIKFLVACIILQTIISILSKGDWMILFRLFVPVYVFLVILLIEFLSSVKLSSKNLQIIVFFIVIMSSFSSLFSLGYINLAGSKIQVNIDKKWADYINENSNLDSVIITTDPGVIGFFNPFKKVIDSMLLVSNQKELEVSMKEKLPARSFLVTTSEVKKYSPFYKWGINSFRKIDEDLVSNQGYFSYYYSLYQIE